MSRSQLRAAVARAPDAGSGDVERPERRLAARPGDGPERSDPPRSAAREPAGAEG